MNLNPLSGELAVFCASTHSVLRNFDEANRYYDIAIKLSPDPANLHLLKVRTILRLSGDTNQARAAIKPVQGLNLRSALSSIEIMLDLYEGKALQAMKRLSPKFAANGAAEDVSRTLQWAQICGLAGNLRLEKKFYQSASRNALAIIQQQPANPDIHSLLGIAYAGLGRKQDAIREGKAAVDLLQPRSKDVLSGLGAIESLAQKHAMVGEQDESIRLLEYLMSIPGDLGIGALRLDPAWKPLRNNPKFLALLHKYGG